MYLCALSKNRVKKKFVINLIFLLFLNILVKPFWIFGVERSVQNIVGASEFGFYFSLFNFSLLLNIVLDLGIINFNNRNISQNPQLLGKHLSNIVSLKFILAIVYAVLTISAALIIGYDMRQLSILGILIFNQFLSSLILYLRSNVSGLQLFKTDSILSVLDRFIMIAICSILVWGNVAGFKLSIEWFVLSQTVAYLITAVIAFVLVLFKAGRFRFNFDFRFFRVFLRKSYPYALLILLMAFYNRIDSVMLERLLPDGKEQAGIYAQAYRILEAASMFPYLFSIILLPMFARMIKKKEKVDELVKLAFSLIIVPAVFLVSVCHFYSEEIMDLMYWEQVDSSALTLSFLMTGFVGISTTYIFGTLLTANGSLKQLNLMALTGMVLNIGLNLILIPHYHVIGSAFAGMVTQIFTAFAQMLIANRIFKFRINYKLIFSLLVFISITISSAYFLSTQNLNWIATIVIVGLISVFASFITGLFKLREVFAIIKQRNAE